MVASDDGLLELQQPNMRSFDEVTEKAQHNHASTDWGHTPPGRGPFLGLRGCRGPHRGSHHPRGAGGHPRLHVSATQAPHPKGKALGLVCSPPSLPFLRGRRGDTSTYASRPLPSAAKWTEILWCRLVTALRRRSSTESPATTRRGDPPWMYSSSRCSEWEQRLQQLLHTPHVAATRVHRWLTAAEGV